MQQDASEIERQKFEDFLRGMSKEELRWTLDSVMAKNAGVSVEEFRAQREFIKSLYDEGEAYRRSPPKQWPPLQFNWDFSLEGQRFALDGSSWHAFKAMYPSGLRLGYMPLSDFDKHLGHFSRRDTLEELWGLGSEFTLAKNIAYLHRGLPITPPLVAPVEGEVLLRGGHHRYAIAKALELKVIPFLVAPDDVSKIERIMSVTWGIPPTMA